MVNLESLISSFNQMDKSDSKWGDEIIDQVSSLSLGDQEMVWEEVLENISENEVTEKLFQYLINNKMCLVSLAHMKLKDDWLFQLIPFDDAALYSLSIRYYRMEEYSKNKFEQFLTKYLNHRPDLCLFLLEVYGDKGKIDALLDWCQRNGMESDVQDYILARQIALSISEGTIRDMYENNQGNGIVLLSIAKNRFTPDDILRTLCNIQKIPFSKQIRVSSRQTCFKKTHDRTN